MESIHFYDFTEEELKALEIALIDVKGLREMMICPSYNPECHKKKDKEAFERIKILYNRRKKAEDVISTILKNKDKLKGKEEGL